MPDPTRFPAELPYDKWPSVASCFDLMAQGNWTAAQALFESEPSRTNITDSIGAGNYWRDKFNPGGTPVPTKPAILNVGETLPWFNSPSGQVNVTNAGGAGKASASAASGGVPCWISLDPTFPNDESKTSYGAGATGYIYPAAGQPFYFKQTGGGDQDMRASIESL